MPGPVIVKATLFFQTGSFGWTESFLWDGQTTNDLNPHMASLQILAQKRAALLGAQSFIKAERVSFETDLAGLPVNGDSVLVYSRYNGASTPQSDDPDARVLVTMRNLVAAKRRNMFLGGIWDDVNGLGGFYLPGTPGWQTAFNSWSAAMLARQIGWWSYGRVAEANVSGYIDDPDSGIVIVTLDDGIFGAGPYSKQRVRIAGVNVRSPLNGSWVGTPTAVASFQLDKPLALLPYVAGGTLRTYARVFEAAASIDGQKIVTRRAGAPLLQSRGRRRAQIRA
jgi:hypothetical protein